MSAVPPYDPYPPGRQPSPPPAAASKSKTVFFVLLLTALVLVICIGVVAALVLPAFLKAPEASRRFVCNENIRNLGLALDEYETQYGMMPPAYTVDANGNRLHSWRTLILPYMGHQQLYDRIDLSKPWDDPVNAAARQTAIEFFTCPAAADDGAAANRTSYVVIVDKAALFTGSEPKAMADVTDGAANTLLAIEIPPGGPAIEWMEPRDLSPQELVERLSKAGNESSHYDGFHVMFADGRTNFFPNNVDLEQLKAVISRSGGEVAQLPY